MEFELIGLDRMSKARAAVLKTTHGDIQTPVFMPVGTAATVKGVHQRELSEMGFAIILSNTYHLYLRPGTEIIEHAKGIHGFANWEKAVLTDSGGYQVYSLSANRKISEKGVQFQSHIDGSFHQFTPEGVLDIQRSLGSDIIMPLDECTPYPCDRAYTERSIGLTHRWLERTITRFNETAPKYGCEQALFGIVQGGVHKDLRKASAEFVSSCNLSGNAIGGLSVGEPAADMYEMTELVCNILPGDKPRYLMGVGTPANLLECIALGVDMFDCVIPTRNGRNGWLYTTKGIINIKNEKWKNDTSPIDPEGSSFVDHSYSKSYLRHLIISGELLGSQIASMHNLGFYKRLMDEAGRRILDGTFAHWKKETVRRVEEKI